MKHLLIEAEAEIQRLRRRNEILAAQINIVEVFATTAGMRQGRDGMAMGVDVAWRLRQEIDAIEKKEADEDLSKSCPERDSGPDGDHASGGTPMKLSHSKSAHMERA